MDKASMQILSIPSLTPKVNSIDSSARVHSSFAFGLSPGTFVPASAALDENWRTSVETSMNRVDASREPQLVTGNELQRHIGHTGIKRIMGGSEEHTPVLRFAADDPTRDMSIWTSLCAETYRPLEPSTLPYKLFSFLIAHGPPELSCAGIP